MALQVLTMGSDMVLIRGLRQGWGTRSENTMHDFWEWFQQEKACLNRRSEAVFR
ncbi:hypothetical protein GCM10028771_21810 [Nocardioides marmoraquaticus]